MCDYNCCYEFSTQHSISSDIDKHNSNTHNNIAQNWLCNIHWKRITLLLHELHDAVESVL